MSIGKLASCFVLSTTVALGAASAYAASTASYVQDGLIACWDGIENAGAGVHDGSATVWKDVKGGYEFNLTGHSVGDDCITFAGSSSSYGTLSDTDTASTFVAAKNGTLEIVYASRTGSGTQVLLQSTASAGLAFGLLSGNLILPYTSSGATKPKYSFTSGAATNTVAVRYTAGAPAAAIANGLSLISSANDTWGSPGTVTFIGNRASQADNTHFDGSIYCIRLYSRQLTDEEIAANQAIDQMRFILHIGSDTLKVTTSAEGIGSPSPEYGYVHDLAAGGTVSVSCGKAAVTNANGSVYSCTGWKTFNEGGTQVSSGPETSFTYTHPSPAEYRELQWQWEMTTPPTDYIRNGLIAFWDGIQNAEAGVHIDGTNVWKDLVEGYGFTLNNTTVGDDCMIFDGTSTSYGTLSSTDTASTFAAAKDGTMEIVYRSTSSAASQVLLQSTHASGLAFGIWGTSKILPFTSGSQASQLSFSFTSGTFNNFVAVRYTSGAPISAIANGSALASAESSSWNDTGTETFVGNRKSKANGFAGSIYAIRLYSRQLTDLEIAENQTVDRNRFSQTVDNSRLVISSTQEGVGAPSPAYGYLTGLAAGDTRIVFCGETVVTNAAEDIEYTCLGWKLYDVNGSIVDSGNTSSFTYTHPTPAAFRRLEWVWQPTAVKGTVVAGAGGSVSPSGTAWYETDTPTIVAATPDSDRKFTIWTGTLPDGVSDLIASVTFTPTAPFTMTANFGTGFRVASTGSDDDDGSDEHPFATISNAIAKADAAIAGGAQHVIINVADGTYPENGLVVTNAIVIVGNAADRTAVKIGTSGARVFRIAHADAALKNLTVTNGTVTAKDVAYAGGNVRLENGTVANCVLTGGGINSLTDDKGGNLYISGGMVVDSLLTSPLVGSGSMGSGAYIAGGVVSRCIIENAPAKKGTWLAIGTGAYLTGGVIENCLVRNNHAGKGAIYLNGAAKAVNCTIVGNSPDSGSDGGIGGVYVKNTAASVVNCVIFGNGGTVAAEWGNNNGAKFFNCVSTVDNGSGVNWIKLPLTNRSSYFKDDEYWTPLLGSPMVDAGDDSRYPSTSSQTDIAGNARISGSHIDIGCSELDQSSFNVAATVESHPSVLKGGTVDFVCSAVGASGVVTYELDFGDGSAHLVTTNPQISRRFDVAGLFQARVRGRDGSGEYGNWITVSVPICVAEADLYVSTEGNDANAGTAAAPFLTISHALATLTNVNSSCATDVDGVTVHIAAGTYEENGLPAIGSGVTVEGDPSDRTAVKVGKSGARIFCLADENAVLRNLTVQNGTVTAADVAYAGGNVRLENGTVTNCVLTGGYSTVQDGMGLNLYIRSGMAVDSLLTSPLVGSGPLGPGAYIAGGVVSRCIIEKAPAKTGTWLAIGSGAYLKGGVIENCLVRDNHAGKGAIYLDAASAKAVNCTIVGNTPVSGAGVGGVYVNNTSAQVVNCVIYGNGGTATAEWANQCAATFYSCAFSADAAFTGANSTVTNLTDAAFKNVTGGDYHPKSGGALFNAGTNELYSSYAISTTDLDGSPRIQSKIIDIGCFEVDSGRGFTLIVR